MDNLSFVNEKHEKQVTLLYSNHPYNTLVYLLLLLLLFLFLLEKLYCNRFLITQSFIIKF